MTITDISTWHRSVSKLANSKALGTGSFGPKPLSQVLSESNDLFSAADRHSNETPKSKCESVDVLSKYLTAPFQDDVVKLRALFAWVAQHISYDLKGYLSGHRGSQTAEGVLSSRVSVCEGYANLFLALCEASHLKAWKVTGAAMGVGMEAGDPAVNLDAHAWNVVLVNGEYRFIETTWAAGSIMLGHFEKHYDPEPYFLVSPTQFIYSHIPKTDPVQQFLSVPLTHQEWMELPHLGPACRPNGIRLVHATGLQQTNPNCLLSYLDISDDYLEIIIQVVDSKFASTGGVLMGQITYGKAAPIQTAGKSLIWIENPPHKDTLHSQGGQSLPLLTHSHRNTSTPPGHTLHTLRANLPHGDFVVRVMASLHKSVNSCYPALTFRVKNRGQGSKPPPPVVYAGSVKPIDPLVGKLVYGSTVTFRVQGAHSAIVYTPSKKVIEMHSSGDGFWSVDVHVCERGEWRVGHVEGMRYSFGGLYTVA
ncbi:hypothetical protein HDU79_004686 [Rhizoclosmatium sp. JEL0117]|nr:hypothetical protein HDU79_004686 [Rhizoclosmatium sp. JEL0117]